MPASKRETGFADVNGTRLHYHISGTGPALILMHGFGGDLSAWDDMLEYLEPNFRVILYDMRGFGKSSLPTDTNNHYAEDLKALMDRLGIQKAFIGGQSLGGLVTTKFALRYPDSVAALVLIDAGLEGFDWSDEFKAFFEEIFEVGKRDGIPAAKALAAKHPLGEPVREVPELAAKSKRIRDNYSGWHYVNMTPYGHHDPEVARNVSKIHQPALVLVGERDMPDFHRIADHLVSNMPHARKRILKNVGHSPHYQMPKELSEIISEFLAPYSIEAQPCCAESSQAAP